MEHTLKKVKSTDQGAWKQFAHVISEIFNPVFVALPTFLAISLASAPDILHALLWWIIAVSGISLAPRLFVLRGVRRGYYSDHRVSMREQRFIPLLFMIGCVGAVFVLLSLLDASHVLMATVAAVIITCSIVLLITRYWKISVHLVGMAGAVTVCVLLFGPLLWLLSPLVPLGAWARWRVGAHTLLQTVAGMVLAVSVIVTVFWLLGIVRLH